MSIEFQCESLAVARTSRSKRASIRGSPAFSGRMSFTAQGRFIILMFGQIDFAHAAAAELLFERYWPSCLAANASRRSVPIVWTPSVAVNTEIALTSTWALT